MNNSFQRKFCHKLYYNKKFYKLGYCELNYIYKNINIGNGVTVDVYDPKTLAKGRVVYLHGGPNIYHNFKNNNLIRNLVYNGYAVDVLNFSGSLYSYNTASKLNKTGLKSHINDVNMLSAYINNTSSKYKFNSLVVESYSGLYFRFINVETLNLFRSIHLFYPLGSFDRNNLIQERESINNNILRFGTEIYYGLHNSYYKDLKCSWSTKTYLYFSTNDKLVNPQKDYKNCFTNTNFKILKYDGSHGAERDQMLHNIYNN